MFIGNNIEVTRIDKKDRTICVHVHYFQKPERREEAEAFLHNSQRIACKYLIDEGFIPPVLDGWSMQADGVLHL
jgi:hypothetical protein